MIEVAKILIDQLTPLPAEVILKRANCFNAIQLCMGKVAAAEFLGPEQFVAYLQDHFVQIDLTDSLCIGDVSVIWSRSSSELPQGSIRINELRKENANYPFGLIIEHSFLLVDDDLVFQKRDPTQNGPYEIITESEAIAPYLGANGFEVTRHRCL